MSTKSIFDILEGARCKVCQKRQIECEMFSPFHMMCEDCLQEDKMKDKISMFIQCEKCKESRNSGDFLSANSCRDCKGQGFKRSRDSYICNKCGDNLCPESSFGYYPFGLVETNVSGGYDSTHLCDMITYQFSMCEKCLRDFFNTCKIPPKIFGDFSSYEEESEAYENRLWRESGGEISKLEAGFCTKNKECEFPAEYRILSSGSLTQQSYCEKHKSSNNTINYEFLPENTVKHLPIENRTFEQRLELANIIMDNLYPNDKPYFIRFMPLDVGCLISSYDKQDGTSCIWLPNSVKDKDIPKPIRDLCDELYDSKHSISILNGCLYYDKESILYPKMLKLNYKEPILDNDDHDFDKKLRESESLILNK